MISWTAEPGMISWKVNPVMISLKTSVVMMTWTADSGLILFRMKAHQQILMST